MRNRLQYRADNCSLVRALEIVGERWSLLVLREAFLGLRRFDDFATAIGCARNILTARLASLVEHGILVRAPYREPGSRTRHEYHLTERGRELVVGVAALMQWGDRHLADAEGPPIDLRHRGCGQHARAVITCAEHGALTPAEIAVRPGTGAKRIA